MLLLNNNFWCVGRAVGSGSGIFRQRSFQRFTDQALIGDAPRFGLGFQGGDQGFGQAHRHAGGFRQGLETHGFELAEIERGEVLVEEVFGVGGQDGNGFWGRVGHVEL